MVPVLRIVKVTAVADTLKTYRSFTTLARMVTMRGKKYKGVFSLKRCAFASSRIPPYAAGIMDGYDINIDHISRQNCGVLLASLSNKDLCTPNQQDTTLPVPWTHVVIATTSTTIVVILFRRYNVIDVFARKGKNNTVGKLSVWHDAQPRFRHKLGCCRCTGTGTGTNVYRATRKSTTTHIQGGNSHKCYYHSTALFIINVNLYLCM